MKKIALSIALMVTIISCEKSNLEEVIHHNAEIEAIELQKVDVADDVVYVDIPEEGKLQPSADRNPYGDFIDFSMILSEGVRVYRLQPQIDPAFQVYWDEFVQAAKATPGVCGVCIENIEHIKIQFKLISQRGIAFIYNDYTRDKRIIDILINPRRWQGLTPGEKKVLLWHELGHSVFRADHTPEGIMSSDFIDQSDSAHFRDVDEWMGLFAQGENRNKNKVAITGEANDLRFFQEYWRFKISSIDQDGRVRLKYSNENDGFPGEWIDQVPGRVPNRQLDSYDLNKWLRANETLMRVKRNSATLQYNQYHMGYRGADYFFFEDLNSLGIPSSETSHLRAGDDVYIAIGQYPNFPQSPIYPRWDLPWFWDRSY